MQRGIVAFVTLLAAGTASAVLAQQAPPVTASVTARGETAPVGTSAGDAADDPAIWRNPRDPAASLIVATDKKAGLYVYGLDGKARHFVPAGRVNNVDLIDMGAQGIIVAASDRNDVAKALLQLYRLDTKAQKLESLGAVPGGAGEAYGVCLTRSGAKLQAVAVLKSGTVAATPFMWARRIGASGPSMRVPMARRTASSWRLWTAHSFLPMSKAWR